MAKDRPSNSGATHVSWLALPFDALRAQHAGAVQAGFIERSLLASARFERALAGLERWMLGPLARRI